MRATGPGTYRCQGGTCTEIYNPSNSGSWSLTIDVDFDGIPDSTGAVLGGCTAYNGFNPIHKKSGNFLFQDGSVHRIQTRDCPSITCCGWMWSNGGA